MPDRFGLDHLVRRGEVTRRCVWCSYSPPVSASKSSLESHARKHARDAQEAKEASLRELRLASEAIKV